VKFCLSFRIYRFSFAENFLSSIKKSALPSSFALGFWSWWFSFCTLLSPLTWRYPGDL